ncbi:Gfo/Idh/MocA family oxidoreductase [Aquincola sp. S2]|uniref:Gfo/Idh/MocA family oxidoreductase n=1 Tax=Pseudaquabacterium terrae TaxID=2732868 RepID=A0ABX2ET59_9BURK|nr:Gfo/Idh/MocA family oxidoreductase [Aquabacterium terrae]NRF71851.1 Gfo/Idh/MocA family oxidoreductase [Aquabacterium terrae]
MSLRETPSNSLPPIPSAAGGWNEAFERLGNAVDPDIDTRHRELERPVRVLMIGAGHRGSIYAGFALHSPGEMQVVAVADPNPLRRNRLGDATGVPAACRFDDWREALAAPRVADAVIIATPDREHAAPCLRALALGYDVLLEKPIAPTEAECRTVLAAAQASGGIVAVCHVLRYAPYFRALKALLASGAVGQVISVQHLEPIEHRHMCHSYVRGNWRRSEATSPIILNKSCHDTDIVRWLVGEPVERVQCFGNLKWFTQRNAPPGSTERCIDGCAVEPECPHSALRIYHRERQRLHVFDLPPDQTQWEPLILQRLRDTDYGRCVFRLDNDQPDHLSVNILFRNGATAAFSMEAMVSYEGRRTCIMGSLGDIVGDMEHFVFTSFKDGSRREWRMKTDAHGGGDLRLVRDWVQAVGQRDKSLLSSSIEVSVESHLMAFAAERSRLNGTIEAVAV